MMGVHIEQKSLFAYGINLDARVRGDKKGSRRQKGVMSLCLQLRRQKGVMSLCLQFDIINIVSKALEYAT
jgi:hypothetical protein